MRSIFLIVGLIVGGFGGWGIAQLGDSDSSSDQVLAASETEAEPSATSTTTESTQPETETTAEEQEEPTATTLETGSEPTTTEAEETPTSSSTTTTTTTTTGSTETTAAPTTTTTTTTTTAAPTTTTTAAPTTTTTTPPTTTTTTTTTTPPSTTTTTAPPTTQPPTEELAATTTLVLSPPEPARATIQISGCRVPWQEGVRCVVARGINHPPGEYGAQGTVGAWTCTIEMPELRNSQSFDYMICPPVETFTDAGVTTSYVPAANRRLYSLNQVQEFVEQLDDCQMETRLVNLPISVQAEDGTVSQVDMPAIEHILHCVLRQ